MKKLAAYILSLSFLLSAVLPCTILDNCEDSQKTDQTSKHEEKKDCKNCLPFSTCASCHGFTINALFVLIEPVAFHITLPYSDFQVSSKSEYYSSLFQPPRIA